MNGEWWLMGNGNLWSWCSVTRLQGRVNDFLVFLCGFWCLYIEGFGGPDAWWPGEWVFVGRGGRVVAVERFLWFGRVFVRVVVKTSLRSFGGVYENR